MTEHVIGDRQIPHPDFTEPPVRRQPPADDRELPLIPPSHQRQLADGFRSPRRFLWPSTELRECVRVFADAMQDGTAALFLGAGMSRESGYVDWKGFLRSIAVDVGLDIEVEHDLPAVVQYYLNQRGEKRPVLDQIIVNSFGRAGQLTENHRIIARLALPTVWTTNYDTLVEDALIAAGRIPDVKREDVQFGFVRPGRDVTVYKMHGDISDPHRVVISSDDYERYPLDHPLFQRALEGDLVTKTFLFLGFSFRDPNLRYLLGHLRGLLKNKQRAHFAVMRKVRINEHAASDEKALADFKYNSKKQQLQVDDLMRYGIRTILVDYYHEVTALLAEIERAYYAKHVFVSGSAHTFTESFGEDRMRSFCMLLGEQLIRRRYNIVSGLGLNIGDSLLKGALVELFAQRERSLEKRLCLRPFPRSLPPGLDEDEYNFKYRSEMIARSNFAIFVAGTSRSAQFSRGVLQEYSIARACDLIPLPVGATGFAARRLWEDVARDLGGIYRGAVPMSLFQRLNDQMLSNEELVEAVFEVMQRTTGAPPSSDALAD